MTKDFIAQALSDRGFYLEAYLTTISNSYVYLPMSIRRENDLKDSSIDYECDITAHRLIKGQYEKNEDGTYKMYGEFWKREGKGDNDLLVKGKKFTRGTGEKGYNFLYSTSRKKELDTLESKIKELPTNHSGKFYAGGKLIEANQYLEYMGELAVAYQECLDCDEEHFATTTTQRKTRDLKEYGSEGIQEDFQNKGIDVSIHPINRSVDCLFPSLVKIDVKFLFKSTSKIRYGASNTHMTLEAFFKNRDGKKSTRGICYYDADPDLIYAFIIDDKVYHVPLNKILDILKDVTDDECYRITHPTKKTLTYKYGYKLDVKTLIGMATKSYPIPQLVLDTLKERAKEIRGASDPLGFETEYGQGKQSWFLRCIEEDFILQR